MSGCGERKRDRHGALSATRRKGPGSAAKLTKRTLTNVYNERPAWLNKIHKRLDDVVFAAHGWSPDISDDELQAKLLARNLERAAR